jgi:hypothetical protein
MQSSTQQPPNQGAAAQQAGVRLPQPSTSHKLAEDDFEFYHPDATLNYPEDITLVSLRNWGPWNIWVKKLKDELSAQRHPNHPFFREPFIVHSIDIIGFDHRKLGYRSVNVKLTLMHRGREHINSDICIHDNRYYLVRRVIQKEAS